MTKQQRNVIIAALAAAVIVGLVLLAKKGGMPGAGPASKGPLVKDDLTVTRVLERDKEQENGFVYLPYARSAEKARFVNVAIDLNGDGAYAAYDIEGGKQEEWLVRNFAAFTSPGASVGFPVSLPDRTIGAKLPANAMAVFTEARIEADAWPSAMPEGAIAEAVHLRQYGVADRDLLNVRVPGGRLDTGRGAPGSAPPADTTPGATGPATRMTGEPDNYTIRHEDVPDTDQRSSECSPTGISNGFRWLAKKYGFEDRMPGSTESLINELKGDLQWNNGVTPGQNTIDGKRAFIVRHQLPLEAHMIGEEWDRNIQYKIFQELQKGQAVEAGIAFITPDGHWDGAHLVGIAGVANYGSGDRFINIIDPDEPARTDGGNSEVYHMEGNEIIAYSSGVASRIRFAYAQSPVTDGGGNFVYPAGAKDFVLDPGDHLAEPGSDLTLSRGDFGFFQVAVDHPGDHMVGESFDIAASVTWTGRRKDLGYYVDGVRHVYSFGAARPWTLAGHFNGAMNVTPTNVLLKPDRKDVSGRSERVEARFTCAKPGLAKIIYVAEIGWSRDGGVVPAGMSEKYRRQIRNSQTMVVDSPVFRCMARPAPTATNSSVAPTPFCPGVTEDPNGQEIPVLKVGAKCYPTSQFHIGNPDACKARHWHASFPLVIALDGSKIPDPNPHECGFGKVGEVPEGTVKLSLDEAAKLMGGALER